MMQHYFETARTADGARSVFTVRPIESRLAERIRATLRDDFGNVLNPITTDAPRSNPCRHCLRLTDPGERLIVFAYRPFETSGPYAEVGPIFIHAGACDPYSEASGIPLDFRERPLTLRAYDARGNIHCAEVAGAGAAEEVLERFFADPAVAFVHARNPAWGCFDFRLDRASATDT
jgi:hypothetical protein